MDIPALVASASLLQTVKYINVASGAVLVFDYFQTLGMEVEFIWTSEWSIAKVLFLLARYTAFVDVPMVLYYALAPNVPHRTCHLVYAVSSYSTALGIAFSEAIMILRTYALWGNNRKILIFLLTYLGVIAGPVLVILTFFLRSLRYGEPPLPTITGCYPTEGSIILFADFVLLISLETIIMALTLWIGIKRFRHSHNRLVYTLYRDGIFFFVYLFLISAGNIIVLVAGPPEYVDLLNTFQRVMHSVLSTRVMLHSYLSERSTRRSTEKLAAKEHPDAEFNRTSSIVPGRLSKGMYFTVTSVAIIVLVESGHVSSLYRHENCELSHFSKHHPSYPIGCTHTTPRISYLILR
ncbi:hypothetical protein LshimejAT787_2600610 [Lyophyllum shimeji]|uniref:DUF6533 domain-containing protein n=1 Tax=Lyophyllum shimeji TaxID=47721 RepID=A0A9P3UUK8_LYOSH|nr:hypothetical protein LshimejAT787_2600610 [Lyophyllum shimeji]